MINKSLVMAGMFFLVDVASYNKFGLLLQYMAMESTEAVDLLKTGLVPLAT
jgi:hypothetical protein